MYTETWPISTAIREGRYKGTTICYLQNFPEKKPNWDCTFKDLSFGQACKFMQSYKILMAHFIE